MICVSIMARDNAEALTKIQWAANLAGMLELRLDVMFDFDIKEMIDASKRPVIATYRTSREGGEGSHDYRTQIKYLEDAVKAGADFIDVEYSMPPEFRRELLKNHGSSKVIISKHILHGTPSGRELEEIFKNMAATGADIIKIISFATSPEDNLRILGLLPLAGDYGREIIAFCMGPLGRISRVVTVQMGGYLTFASLEEGQESASGQIPIKKMKAVLEMLSS